MLGTNTSARRSASLLAAVLALFLVAGVLVTVPGAAPAAAETRPMRFPIFGGRMPVDTFGAPRSGGRTHQGQDIFAPKMSVLVATRDATVVRMSRANSGLSGNSLVLKDADGWEYVYIHVNNDTPGTDDGANRDLEMFLPGLYVGAKVHSGQAIGFVGDSGNAETTPPHLHFELHAPTGEAINPFDSLLAADRSAPDPSVWAAGIPFGNLESTGLAPGGLALGGWAADPDGGRSATEVYVDGYLAGAAIPSGGLRPDVAAIYGPVAATSGFAGVAPAGPGTHQVCAYARNTGRGPAGGLGCRPATIPGLPFGNIDALRPVTGTARAVIEGWAIDAQTAAPIEVHVYVNGRFAGFASAAVPRLDIAAAYPGFGPGHGFAIAVPVGPGTNTVCAYAIDPATPDRNRLLGCPTVAVPTGAPFGNVEGLVRVPGGAVLEGWAIDPDTSAPIEVDVWSAGQFAGFDWASLRRPDVAAAFPGAGEHHGYAVYLPAAAGTRTWCGYGINIPAGVNASLGCRSMTISNAPVGSVDAVGRIGDAVTVTGWGLDPDVLDAATVDAYIDGTRVRSTTTGVTRTDVAAAWPAYGTARGYSLTLTWPPGTHQLCVAVRNAGAGSADTVLNCRQV